MKATDSMTSTACPRRLIMNMAIAGPPPGATCHRPRDNHADEAPAAVLAAGAMRHFMVTSQRRNRSSAVCGTSTLSRTAQDSGC